MQIFESSSLKEEEHNNIKIIYIVQAKSIIYDYGSLYNKREQASASMVQQEAQPSTGHLHSNRK